MKQFFTLLFVSIAFTSFAQSITWNGTLHEITTPNGTGWIGAESSSLFYLTTDRPEIYMNSGLLMANPSINAYNGSQIHLKTNNITQFMITADGRVGIGKLSNNLDPGRYNLAGKNTTFNSKLDVNGEVLAREGFRMVGPSTTSGLPYEYNVFSTSINQSARGQYASTGWVAKVHSSGWGDPVKLSFFDGYSSAFTAYDNALLDVVDSQPIMTLLAEYDRVGIGTTAPTQKLSVKGKINAEEIILEDVATGADFVFEEDYDLRSLEETEKFIKANKHLPEIPSAAEMIEEGIEIKTMNILLLQKVEELTLHLIALKKEVEEFKKNQ